MQVKEAPQESTRANPLCGCLVPSGPPGHPDTCCYAAGLIARAIHTYAGKCLLSPSGRNAARRSKALPPRPLGSKTSSLHPPRTMTDRWVRLGSRWEGQVPPSGLPNVVLPSLWTPSLSTSATIVGGFPRCASKPSRSEEMDRSSKQLRWTNLQGYT